MSVKRYEWVACDEHSCHCDVVESVDGDMVDYEDYAALEARCAALAAELSAVEVIHNEAVFITDEHYEKCPPEVQKMIRSLAVMQIPAYQAFLAEVRASAVDDVCLKISNAIINCYQDEQIGLDAAATICGDFTAQLRKGVQS
ncbi:MULTISPECIES: hypothetical protein [Enterobacter cloacae complex]|uniref:hypothetical protein n=1 Tax=Enterobacter cloacae complex TaxID=354276 RepID=UPI0003DD1C61|nr:MULTISPECIES: hypothetical protein [Enterobacter cloacae complex]HAV1698115.1 hypothetical protein [Enterobacter hormaechei subsp. steigerwaltii]EHF4942361.1 hypothetical protein [Enterobacter hormaechei]EHF5008533.1 hypothetical protein [Enterobacter hormaechei]EKS6457330.1 hypothetical protein [Enterobacter hormaechei]EKS6603588.1 hypothetical protein [Enterobacter hormaechei]